ncbi:MAG: hypothetical protein K1X50_05500 [Candidatus Promineofilum sp.]|nr:hypothetical protein [Promineifilum sp.]MCW5863642.1 hypothetical protein [Anaerolineae bacterium]
MIVDDAAEAIRAAAVRVAGLHLVRVAESHGRYAAVFEVQPIPTYSKGLATRWHSDLSTLLSSVLDTLEHIQGEIDVNIFSAEMFEYLSAEMLPNDGRPVTMTIKDVAQETITGPRGEAVKVIVSFRERPKKLILNKTNARALARSLGAETDAWAGAAVELGVEPVKVGRQTVPSIRVRSATAAQRQTTAAARTPQQATPQPATQPAFADVGPVSRIARPAEGEDKALFGGAQ